LWIFSIEQLKVTIPWNSLSTHPTEVYIDGLYLLIVPKNGMKDLNRNRFLLSFVEMSQDLSKHYTDKSKRVEQKLDNLRKAALSQYGEVLISFL
jgi:hypothetical protein